MPSPSVSPPASSTASSAALSSGVPESMSSSESDNDESSSLFGFLSNRNGGSTPSAGSTALAHSTRLRPRSSKTRAIQASNAVGSACACPLGGGRPLGSAHSRESWMWRW